MESEEPGASCHAARALAASGGAGGGRCLASECNNHPRWETVSIALVFALKYESRILGQWSNPVFGSRKSKASSP